MTAPPSAAQLDALDNDDWGQLIVLARRGLRALDGADLTPVVRRLVAAPSSQLVAGRSKDDLVRLLAAGGAPWAALCRAIDEEGAPRPALVALRRGEAPAWPDLEGAAGAGAPGAGSGRRGAGRTGGAGRGRAGPRTGRAETRQSAAVDGVGTEGSDRGRDRLVAERDRLRERGRELKVERDDLRRRLDGSAAQATRRERDLAQAVAEAAALADRVAVLERQAAAAADERRQAVEREQRRQEAEVRKLRDELAELRRAEHAWRDERRRLEEEIARLRTARKAAPGDRPRGRRGTRGTGATTGFVSGRPSRLPDTVVAGTTEAVELLLSRGRRVLVDGHNVVLQHRPDLTGETGRQWLVQALATLAARYGVEPVVVFDGAGDVGSRTRTRHGVGVWYSVEGKDAADAEIVLEVHASPNEPITVVTDDAGLRAQLVADGVDVVPTRPFVGLLR